MTFYVYTDGAEHLHRDATGRSSIHVRYNKPGSSMMMIFYQSSKIRQHFFEPVAHGCNFQFWRVTLVGGILTLGTKLLVCSACYHLYSTLTHMDHTFSIQYLTKTGHDL